MHDQYIFFAVLFAVALGALIGIYIGPTITKWRDQKAVQARLEYLKSLSGKWMATGDNADMFDADTGTNYIEVPMIRVMRVNGVDRICMADVLHIPNIGHSPARGEVMWVRIRAPSDLQPPHWKSLGCHLFASTCGYFLTNEGKTVGQKR